MDIILAFYIIMIYLIYSSPRILATFDSDQTQIYPWLSYQQKMRQVHV